MKFLIRLFFRTLRRVLAPFMLLWFWLTRPKPLVRHPSAQQAVDARTSRFALYHFPACPFCLKVRREMHRLGLNIELRNAQHDAAHRAKLVAATGKTQVPCLWINEPGGNSTWLLESDAIKAYLVREFGEA